MWVPVNGLHLSPRFGGDFPLQVSQSSTVIDAVGESTSMIGRLRLTSGWGTSKTISSAGGKIWVVVPGSSVTFANAGTTIRCGIQDVTAGTSVEDGTYDVYGEVIGGSGAFAQSVIVEFTMSSGSKTITHNDLVAIVVEMTAKGGADSVRVGYLGASAGGFPYVATDTGTGPARTSNGPLVIVQFDDGTLGFFDEVFIPMLANTSGSFNSASSPDEYALIVTMPFTARMSGIAVGISDNDSGDDAEMHVYANPFSASPTLLRTATSEGLLSGSASTGDNGPHFAYVEPLTLLQGHTYAFSYRPTTTTARALRRRVIKSEWLAAGWLGTNVTGGARTDQTGAFSNTPTDIPAISAILDAIDIPAPAPRTRTVRTL